MLAEQNQRTALKLSDRGYIIDNGVIRYHGSIEELRADEEMRRKVPAGVALYGGDARQRLKGNPAYQPRRATLVVALSGQARGLLLRNRRITIVRVHYVRVTEFMDWSDSFPDSAWNEKSASWKGFHVLRGPVSPVHRVRAYHRSIYALIALGFCIIHNATGIVNFTQVDFVTLGGLMMYTFLTGLGLPLYAAFPLAVLVVTVVGAMVERLAIRPAKSRAVIILIFITIGVSILMRGTFKILWGKNQMALPHFSGESLW